MMKKKHFATLVALTLFSLFTASCQSNDDDQPEEATLSLSALTLMMDNQAQMPSVPQITYQTNQSKVIVSAPTYWLDASIQGNGILIRAEANTLGHDRKGEILVFAGSAMDKITVTQSSADIVLEVSPKTRTVSNNGEKLFVSVKSSSNAWEIEPSGYDWILVEKFTSELLKVTVLPNSGPKAREGHLFAKLGSISKQINITQVGVSEEKYMLPLLKRQPSQFDIIDYEKNQGNHLVTYTPAYPDWGMMEESYQFACASPIIDQLVYSKDVSKQTISNIVMLSGDPESLKSKEFKEFLKEKGFEIGDITDDDSFTATHAESNFMLTVTISDNENYYSSLRFVPVVQQPQEYPTFNKFPFDKSNILRDPAYPSSKIIEMEEGANATVTKIYSEKVPKLLSAIGCEFHESGDREAPIFRLYFIDIDEDAGTTTDLAGELMIVWKDYTLGTWLDGNAFILTKEFKKLMTEEGFEFYREVGDNSYYYNNTKKLMAVPRGARFTDVLDGAPVFSMTYFNYDDDASSMKDPIVRNILIDKISKRINAHDQYLNIIK